MSISILSFFFIIISFFYSMVGFGGGSSYLAILVLAGLSYKIVPLIALICNIVVVSGGTLKFHKNKLIPWKIVKPLLLSSVPAAFIGGQIMISKKYFLLLLGFSLLIASLRMLFFKGAVKQDGNDLSLGLTAQQSIQKVIPKIWQKYLIGSSIGFLSGLVGIGGGIFLSPLLFTLKWASPKSIAAISSVFILVNSISGLAGQLTKGRFDFSLLSPYLILILCVFIGGQIGSYLCNYKISHKKVERLTAILVLYVAIRLLIF